MESLPPELTDNICSHMNDDDLYSFMKTNRENYDACIHEWRRRHKFLTSEQRQKIRECIRLTINRDIAFYVAQFINYHSNNKEIDQLILDFRNYHSTEFRSTFSKYKHNFGESYAHMINVDKKIAHMILNTEFRSDHSLIKLAKAIDDISSSTNKVSNCSQL